MVKLRNMIFKKKNNNENLPATMREVGYHPIGTTPAGELNCVRPLGGGYPRFHLYIESADDIITFKLHLDQKKPSYGSETMHSGEYESEAVKEEAARIKSILWEQ